MVYLEKSLHEVGKELEGKKILIAGLAYKKNVDDARESPSYEIMDLLSKRGAIVDYSDPYIEIFPETRKYDFSKSSVEITQDTLGDYDAVILATDHDNFDLDLIQNQSQILIDTRGVCNKSLPNVKRL